MGLMKTFKKYFIESDKLKALKKLTKLEYVPANDIGFGLGRWGGNAQGRAVYDFELDKSSNKKIYVNHLTDLFGHEGRRLHFAGTFIVNVNWGFKLGDFVGMATLQIDDQDRAVKLYIQCKEQSQADYALSYILFKLGMQKEIKEESCILENDKLKAFKKFSQTYVIKNKFNSNFIFADDQPNAAANARETERRMEKENMDPYATELLVKHYKDLIDNFGEPNQSRDGGMLYLDWGIEFADGVKVILSIDPHDLYYDEQNNVEPESPIVAQVTGPKGRDPEILGRLDTILNKS